MLTDELVHEFRENALATMRAGIAAAEAEPPARPEELFEHVFVDPPSSFASDLAELRRILGA